MYLFFSISISYISSFRGNPNVYGNNGIHPRPIIAQIKKKIYTFILFLVNNPKIRGDDIEANVPNAEIIPFPIALDLAGYSSTVYIYRRIKYDERLTLEMNTRISYTILAVQKSQSSGFLRNNRTNVQIKVTTNKMMPVVFL